jgi:hypothetical protein
MFNDDARLQQLSVKAQAGDMSDDEFTELAQLSRAKKVHREARSARITGLRETLRAEQIGLADLYSRDEIMSAALAGTSDSGPLGSVPRRARRLAPPQRIAIDGASHSRQKSGLVLIEAMAPGGRGAPCRYCKGESLAKPYVAKGFKALDDGQLEANLARHSTAAGREYFATDEGRAELARLMRFIQLRKVNPRR